MSNRNLSKARASGKKPTDAKREHMAETLIAELSAPEPEQWFYDVNGGATIAELALDSIARQLTILAEALESKATRELGGGVQSWHLDTILELAERARAAVRQ